MQVLQTLEGQDDILLGIELFGLFAEQGLQLQILAEIVVAKVFVNLQLVVKLLHGALIGLPLGCGLGGGHLADQLELGLYLFDARERLVDIVGVGGEGLQLLDQCLFALEVVAALLLLGCGKGGFALFHAVHQLFELLFALVESRDEGCGIVAGGLEVGQLLLELGLTECVKLLFQSGYLLAGDLYGLLGGEAHEGFQHLGFACGFGHSRGSAFLLLGGCLPGRGFGARLLRDGSFGCGDLHGDGFLRCYGGIGCGLG